MSKNHFNYIPNFQSIYSKTFPTNESDTNVGLSLSVIFIQAMLSSHIEIPKHSITKTHIRKRHQKWAFRIGFYWMKSLFYGQSPEHSVQFPFIKIHHFLPVQPMFHFKKKKTCYHRFLYTLWKVVSTLYVLLLLLPFFSVSHRWMVYN